MKEDKDLQHGYWIFVGLLAAISSILVAIVGIVCMLSPYILCYPTSGWAFGYLITIPSFIAISKVVMRIYIFACKKIQTKTDSRTKDFHSPTHMRGDYSAQCNGDDDDPKNPCLDCTCGVWPIGCMRDEIERLT